MLQSGTVMGTRFRIFESHLSYVLQFLCDFGLYGCGNIDLEDGLERFVDLDSEKESPSGNANSIKFSPSSYFRESRLPLELDVIAPQVLNRHNLLARNNYHQFQIRAPQLPLEPLVLSVRELWEDERKHRQELGLDPSPEIPIDPSESSRIEREEWISEARWWDELRMRIERDRGIKQINVNNGSNDWDWSVMTTFDSVEALWDQQYRTWKPGKCTVDESKQGSKPNEDQETLNYSWEAKGDDLEERDVPVEVDISMLSDSDILRLDEEEAQAREREVFRFEEQHLGAEEDLDHETDNYEEEDVAEPADETAEPAILHPQRLVIASAHATTLML